MNATSGIQDYDTACRFLLDLKKRGVSLGLDRIDRLTTVLGNPHLSVPCIHIAGTNGKGSVAAMLEAILRSAGWRTGLYTSPHLVRLGERIQVDRQNLSENALVAHVREFQPIVEEMQKAEAGEGSPTYFEVMTAMAFLHFKRSRCDVACIEVGMGGRIDATNIVTPDVSVITSIGLDHMDILGNTITAIAAEKAGIIKRGRPVVIGRMPPEAEDLIRDVAMKCESPVFSVFTEFGDDPECYPSTNLAGKHQRLNAATAMLAARAMSANWRLSDSVTQRALERVVWAGRWQRFSVAGRTVILDSSHNAEGAQALDGNLSLAFREFGRAPIVVVGVLGTTRARPLLEVICRHAVEVRLVEPNQSRACTYQQLEAQLPVTYSGKIVRETVPNLFPTASICSIGEVGDVIVVTGSIYLAGEVLSRIDPTTGRYEGHLQDF